jgi:serine/threonine protein kinase
MPPETLKYNKYSYKSDIWALGVMAYEMVYGKLPYKEKVESLLYDKIIRTNIEDLFDASVHVS